VPVKLFWIDYLAQGYGLPKQRLGFSSHYWLVSNRQFMHSFTAYM
jgi:hypothetical protein